MKHRARSRTIWGDHNSRTVRPETGEEDGLNKEQRQAMKEVIGLREKAERVAKKRARFDAQGAQLSPS